MSVTRWIFAVLLGSLAGTLGDRGHTYFGVLHYPRPALWGEAWWVPLLFAGATVVMLLSHRAVRTIARRDEPATHAEVATSFAWFAGTYLASAVFKAYPIALTVAFTASFLARMLGGRGRAAYVWVFAFGGAVMGPIAEISLQATGAFTYDVPDVFTIPYWLSPLYLHVALLGSSLERALTVTRSASAPS